LLGAEMIFVLLISLTLTLGACLHRPASTSAGEPTAEPGRERVAGREIPGASNLCRDFACSHHASSISPACRPYKQDRSGQRCRALLLPETVSRPYRHSPGKSASPGPQSFPECARESLPQTGKAAIKRLHIGPFLSWGRRCRILRRSSSAR